MSTLGLNFVCKDVKARQEAVQKAYWQIISETIELLKTLPTPQLRTHIEVPEEGSVHNFISTCIRISLSDDLELISYAKHFECRDYIGFHAYSELSRIIYRNTMRENSSVFIEDCLEEFCYDYTDFEKAMNNPLAKVKIEEKPLSPDALEFLSSLNNQQP